MTSLNSRAETGQCLKEPTFIRKGGIILFTCALPERKDEKDGNFVEFQIVKDALLINRVFDEYCNPKVAACECVPLLKAMFNSPFVIVPNINRIDTRFEALGSTGIDTCICYLNASAKVGFRFVTMASLKPECAVKKEISTEFLKNYEVCNYYVLEHDCGREMVTITKH